jgi:hypothetical protein
VERPLLFSPTVNTERSQCLLSLNIAAVALVEELLRLPSASAARTAIELLYGRDVIVPDAFLDQVGAGTRVPIGMLLPSTTPLATMLPSRLHPSASWQEPAHAVKNARALARDRYRDLQAALVASSARVAPEPLSALVRYTYGTDGRRWLWADVAKRLLDAVVTLNRAALAVLASIARGELTLDVGVPAAGPKWSFDVPDAILDVLAEVLPPAAAPDFTAFARALATSRVPFKRDEAIVRYRSLFAEMLGLASHVEVPA